MALADTCCLFSGRYAPHSRLDIGSLEGGTGDVGDLAQGVPGACGRWAWDRKS
jgi:hypothetical protein